MKILFIDDDLQTLRLMEKEAQILGHQSVACPDSSEAIRQVINAKPDLIFVDVNMQNYNGFQVVDQIRNNLFSASIPVLLLSAGDPDLEGKKAMDVGANGFLSKPLTLVGLETAVKRYIKQGQKAACPAFS
jgi:CheY-like chemotaxis protein